MADLIPNVCTTRRVAAFAPTLIVLSVAALLQGCTPPPPRVSTTRLYAIDQQGGAATCTAAPVTLTEGKEVAGTLTVANDGGWCAISVAASGERPYSAGLLVDTPAHGKVYVHTVGDATRIDYTPDAGFTGTDSYAVKLVPGAASLRVAVTVTPGPASVVATPPAAAAPAATPPTKATKPTRSIRS